MAAQFDYAKMATTADRLLERFRQGLVTVQRKTTDSVRPSDWPVWEPWEPEYTVSQYRLNAVVRAVEFKYIDNQTIRATDQQVTCSDTMTLISVDGAAVEEAEVDFDASLLDTLVIDGVSMTVLRHLPTPGAGTKIVHKFIVRAGAIVAPVQAGPVSINAPAETVLGAGVPQLTLIIDNTAADATVDAAAPEWDPGVEIDAPADVIADVSATPRIAIGISAPASAQADTPTVELDVTGGVTGAADVIVGAGSDITVSVPIDAPASADVDASAPPYGVQVTGAAEVVADAPAPTLSVDMVATGEAGAIVDASAAPAVAVTASGEAGALMDAEAALDVAVQVSAAVGADVDAVTGARVALSAAGAAAVAVDAASGASVAVDAAGAAEAVADAPNAASVAVNASGAAGAIVEAQQAASVSVPAQGGADVTTDAVEAVAVAVAASGAADVVVEAVEDIDVVDGSPSDPPAYASISTSDNSATVARPTGVVEGDLLVGFFFGADGTGITVPSGWTEIGDSDVISDGAGRELMSAVAWKVATGSEPANYTFSLEGGSAFYPISCVMRITGAGTIADSATDKGTASPRNIPSVNAGTNNLLLAAALGYGTQATAAPAGMTNRANLAASAGGNGNALTQTLSSSGATGDKNFAQSAGTPAIWISRAVAINPA